jgi:hypothetical protein
MLFFSYSVLSFLSFDSYIFSMFVMRPLLWVTTLTAAVMAATTLLGMGAGALLRLGCAASSGGA